MHLLTYRFIASNQGDLLKMYQNHFIASSTCPFIKCMTTIDQYLLSQVIFKLRKNFLILSPSLPLHPPPTPKKTSSSSKKHQPKKLSGTTAKNPNFPRFKMLCANTTKLEKLCNESERFLITNFIPIMITPIGLLPQQRTAKLSNKRGNKNFFCALFDMFSGSFFVSIVFINELLQTLQLLLIELKCNHSFILE